MESRRDGFDALLAKLQSPKAERVLSVVLLVLALVVGASQIVFYFTRTVDDLFISLRYAENFANGRGLVYNVGERVEGFSSPLWVLLQAAGIFVGLEGLVATKLLSVLSLGALGASAWAYARHVLGTSRPVASFVVVGIAANSYVLSWGLWGLETPLYLGLLVALPVALEQYRKKPSGRRFGASVGLATALLMARPEAPLFVLVIALSIVVRVLVTKRDDWRPELRPFARVALAVGLAGVLLLLARRAYFGLWLPHTYYAKGSPGFSLDLLRTLFGQGIAPLELGVLLASSAAAAWLAWRRRDVLPLMIGLATAFFVCSVLEDWMPNQRHWLPVWVYGTLALGAALDALLRVSSQPRAGPRAALAGLLVAWVVCQNYHFRIDSRFSRFDFMSHGRRSEWVREKTPERWRDSWLALQHEAPPHIEQMPVHALGMLQQLFWVIESAPEPEAEGWYIARDIGQVGYYSTIKIYDTDGLFTPSVVADAEWARSRRVTPALARKAFALRPAAGQLYDDWASVPLRLRAELRDYRFHRDHFERRGPRPSPAEVLERYERIAAKLPRSFYPSTLYGECFGAAFDKRHVHARRTFEQMTISPHSP